MFIHKSAECARCTIVPRAPPRRPLPGLFLVFFHEKPRRPGVNTVLMGKRFAEKIRIVDVRFALSGNANKRAEGGRGQPEKLWRISSNETTLPRLESLEKERKKE